MVFHVKMISFGQHFAFGQGMLRLIIFLPTNELIVRIKSLKVSHF